eukprot:scaffold89848_cov21-Tisochrysis_lutea.AAC.3
MVRCGLRAPATAAACSRRRASALGRPSFMRTAWPRHSACVCCVCACVHARACVCVCGHASVFVCCFHARVGVYQALQISVAVVWQCFSACADGRVQYVCLYRHRGSLCTALAVQHSL